MWVRGCVVVAIWWVLAGTTWGAQAALSLLDRPVFVVRDQTFRVMVRTEPGTEALDVRVPETLSLYSRRHVAATDTVQRFYFRALRPGLAPVVFRGGDGDSLSVVLEVLSWEGVLQRRRFGEWEIPRIWPMDRPYSGLKPSRTLVSDEEMASLRSEDAVPDSDLVDMTLDGIYESLLGTYVPRNVFVNHLYNRQGCPRCGMEIYKGRSAFYPWRLDPNGHPAKVGCPACGEWFPTNDYAAGEMDGGDLVDDGFGVDLDGHRFSFVAYYNVWHYMHHFLPTLTRLSTAFAQTGDPVMARKAAVGLLRLSEQFLNLSVNLNQRKRVTRETLWNVPLGILPREDIKIHRTWMYVEDNWEGPRLSQVARAYELIFDGLQDEDPELLAFCQRRGHPEIRSMADFRRFVETGYFRTMAQCILDRNIEGNLPQGQRAMMVAALVLGTPETRELVDWTFNGEGQMRFFLTNHYFKDGSAYESQGYNAIHVYELQGIVELMDQLRKTQPEIFGGSEFPFLGDDPKYKQVFDFPVDFSLIGRTHAQSGDCGGVAGTDTLPIHRTTDIDAPAFAQPFRLTRDRRFAQIQTGRRGRSPLLLPIPRCGTPSGALRRRTDGRSTCPAM